ncbi:MAG: 16S rRNA (uracil(1498)-N(3))-methyltransferase [Saprospiraceae bacterium]|nr:16S rRNA (uracil(1498)-N(3))-methyltransferase [Saprospiraceae bacterium]
MQFFYSNEIANGEIVLRDQELQHLSKSLRMKVGDEIWVLDGMGARYWAVLSELNKKMARAQIKEVEREPLGEARLHLAISPTKNINRMEWLLEKATEIGLQQITFIETRRSERSRINMERMSKIAVSAMKQSGNLYLTKVEDICRLSDFLALETLPQNRFIAHCQDKLSTHLADVLKAGMNSVILIGPEGDFTGEEIAASSAQGFQEISLGRMRLRTETAGIFVTSLNAMINRY